MLRDQLTLITPIRMTQPIHLTYFRETMLSYYGIFGEDRPRHLVAAANPAGYYQDEFLKLMDLCNPGGWEDVSPNTKPVQALADLVRAVKTPYVHVVLGDVRAVGQKNFLQIGIDAMEADKSICQMRYGDVPLSNSIPYNTSSFESDGSSIYFKGMPQFLFDPAYVQVPGGFETIWRFPMAAAAQKKWIGFAFWPCTYRTDVFLRVIEAAEKRMDRQQQQFKGTLAGWMSIVNHTADFGGWCLPEKGWPEGFEFLEPLKQGTLNMACYMAALGREDKGFDGFMKTSRIEVKAVPPTGELHS